MPSYMKQGFVLKQGGNRKNWKKRWFALTDRDPGPPYTPALLSYYANASLTSSLGNVNLDECVRAEMIPYFKEHNGHSKLLEIEVPGRIYRLLFKTEAERDDWLSLISRVSRQLQQSAAIIVDPNSDEKALFPEPANAPRLDDTGTTIATTHFCRGWLEKVGNRVKNWKRRWFVLKGYVISYYKDKNTGSPLGIIDLCDCTAVHEKTGPNLQHAFAVETKSREFLMMAENGAEVHMWITAIQQAVRSRDALASETLMRVRTRSEALRKTVVKLHDSDDEDDASVASEVSSRDIPTSATGNSNIMTYLGSVRDKSKNSNDSGPSQEGNSEEKVEGDVSDERDTADSASECKDSAEPPTDAHASAEPNIEEPAGDPVSEECDETIDNTPAVTMEDPGAVVISGEVEDPGATVTPDEVEDVGAAVTSDDTSVVSSVETPNQETTGGDVEEPSRRKSIIL